MGGVTVAIAALIFVYRDDIRQLFKDLEQEQPTDPNNINKN